MPTAFIPLHKLPEHEALETHWHNPQINANTFPQMDSNTLHVCICISESGGPSGWHNPALAHAWRCCWKTQKNAHSNMIKHQHGKIVILANGLLYTLEQNRNRCLICFPVFTVRRCVKGHWFGEALPYWFCNSKRERERDRQTDRDRHRETERDRNSRRLMFYQVS